MTFFKKSLFTLGVAALGFSAILVVSVMAFLNSLYYEINIQGLVHTAKTLMTIIGSDRIAEVLENNASIQGDRGFFPLDEDDTYRVTLIASSGYVLWDSHVTSRLVNHIDREEIIAALGGSVGISRRESVSTHISRIYCALPVTNSSNETIGVFRLSLSIPEFGVRISPVILPFVIFISLFLIAVFCLIFIYSRSLSNSLLRLVHIAQAGTPLLSRPEASRNVAPEFVSLEKAMREMTEELNFRFEQAKSEGSRLEAILNGMSEAVFAMDYSLKLHLINPKARDIFSFKKNDIKNITLLEVTRSTELVEIAKKAIDEGAPIEKELTFHAGVASASGRMSDNEGGARSVQHFQVYASPLAKNNDSAAGCGVVLVMQEITRLVKLERIRKDFVANVSHELRTPIQLVKGFAETLIDTVSGEENENNENIKQIIHFTEIISKNARIMENLTNDLLVLASLENGDNKIYDAEECLIFPLIEEAVSSVEPQSKKKQIEIVISCADDLKAKLYGSFIIQGLINLIDNGIKYSPVKSKLWISARKENDELVFEVRDKGIGIPAEHLERIFERFYRVDRARSREAGGTGLGLSIVRHIALLHRGIAEVESHAGEGSTFRIRIPLNRQIQ